MRQLVKVFITLLILFFTYTPTFAVVQGGIDYKIPIDYSKLNPAEIETEAEFYYNLALQSNKLDDNMTSALNLYTILVNIAPDNTNYALKLGKLYDTINKDRLAKGQYYRALNLNQSKPEPYYYLGDFYYKREQYRKALKFYKKAYDKGYSSHYQTLFKLSDIYQKFGDTQNALLYAQHAESIENNQELDKKIHEIENADNINKEYYRKP